MELGGGGGACKMLEKIIRFFFFLKRTNFRHKEPFARLVYLQTGTEITIIRINSYG